MIDKEFEDFKENNDGNFKVSVFGSSQVKEGDAVFDQVKSLAKMIAENEIDIITGGGPGLMRAANEGHQEGRKENGKQVHSIGIGIKLPWNQKFNESVEYKEELDRFSQRLDEFMTLSNAVVVCPGGLGTMLELFYTWQLAQVHHICNIPIILMGDVWEGLLRWIKDEPLQKNYLEKQDYDLVFHVKNPEEAMAVIKEAHKNFENGDENFCLNYEKYKIK